MTLTDHGQRYFERTRLMIEELDDADDEMTNSSLRVSGPVRISVASTFGRLHVLPLIPELLALYPELDVDLVLSDIVRDMVEDRVDLAIRIGPVDEPDAVVRAWAARPWCASDPVAISRTGACRKRPPTSSTTIA